MKGRLPTPLRVILAVLLGVVLCEGGLRAAGVFYGVLAGDRGGRGGGGPVILCLGDSNVFGIYEPPHECYPAHLQALLDARTSSGARVINLGVPGFNSRQVRGLLREAIIEHDPIAVLVTVGANNGWSWTPDDQVQRSTPPWWEAMRLVKLLRLFGQRVTAQEPHGELELIQDEDGKRFSIRDREGKTVFFASGEGSDAPRGQAFLDSIRRDLEGMADVAGAAEVPLVLASYGADIGSYGKANRVLREVAGNRGLPLVNASESCARLVDRLGFDAVFHMDLHPRGPGYEAIAQATLGKLAEEGIVVEVANAQGPGTTKQIEARPSLAADMRFVGTWEAALGSEEALALEIGGGIPGREFTVAFWNLRPDGAPLVQLSAEELVVSDPLFKNTTRSDQFRGHFDDDGRGRLELLSRLGPTGPQVLGGRAIQAMFVTHGAGGRKMVHSLSPSANLTFPAPRPAQGDGSRP